MNNRILHLKIKAKSLAAESAVIRAEEAKLKKRSAKLRKEGKPVGQLGEARWSLSDHRRGIVRRAARHALLAYAFLRGIDYERVEAPHSRPPDWAEVRRLVDRFGVTQALYEESRAAFQARQAAQGAALEAWYSGKSSQAARLGA